MKDLIGYITLVLDYNLKGKIQQEDIIAGYISDCLIYESKKISKEEV